jgi:MFS family permease
VADRWQRLRAAVLPPSGPGTVLTAQTLISSAGDGVFLAGSVLFFTRVVGLSAADVGLGLSAAGLAGLLASVPAGMLADRWDPRLLSIVFNLALGGLMFGYLFVRSFPAFLVIACLFGVADTGAGPVRNTLTFQLMPRDRRVRLQAYLRAVYNVGISAGTLGAGVALGFDTRLAYEALIAANGASFVLSGAIGFLLPAVPPPPATQRPSRLVALRDHRFVVVMAVGTVLGLHELLLTIGIPLWVLRHTHAPKVVVAGVLMVNTLMAITLQVWSSRGAETVAGAAKVLRRGGVALALCCVPMAAAAGLSAAPAVVLLLVGGVLLTFGEMFQSAAVWGLGFELPPPGLQGSYQGVRGLVGGALETVGPYLVAFLLATVGVLGWAVLGVVFAVTAAVAAPVCRWAAADRPAAAALAPANAPQ